MGTPPKFNSSPLTNGGGWKTILSYLEGNFSGAMLNFGGVTGDKNNPTLQGPYFTPFRTGFWAHLVFTWRKVEANKIGLTKLVVVIMANQPTPP